MIYESKEKFLKQLNKLKTFKVLGIDSGKKKSGLAMYNSEIKLVIPLITFKEAKQNLESLLTLIHDKSINAVVIGLPLKLDGSSITKNIENIKKFAQLLEEKIFIPIILNDERFTTSLANTLLKESNMKRKKRNQIDDVVAACILLQNFFY